MGRAITTWGLLAALAVAVACQAPASSGGLAGAQPAGDHAPAAAAPTTAPAAPPAKPAALTPLSYGHDFLINGLAAPLYLALERGYFAEGGLDVSLSRGYGSADAVKRAAVGQADIVQGDTGAAILLRANEGATIKVVSSLYDKVPFAILYYEDQNITSPKSLEGKSIADAAGSSPRVLFPAFAGLTGIDQSRVNWRTVDAAVRNTNMAAGQLEIISAFSLNLASIEKTAYSNNPNRKIGMLRYADYGVEMYGNGYLASDKLIAERPQAIAAFVEAAAKGLRDTYQDVPAAVEILRKHNPEIDRDIAARELELTQDLLITDDIRANGIGSFQEARMQKTKDIMRQYFDMRGDVALGDVYTTQFVPRSPIRP